MKFSAYLERVRLIIYILHAIISDLVPNSSSELFVWLPREQLCILAFFVSVLHSVQAGHMEKAQKYTDKALQQIEKLRQMDSEFKGNYLFSLFLDFPTLSGWFLCKGNMRQ